MLKARLQEIITIVEQSNVHEVEISYWWGRKIKVTKNASNAAMFLPTNPNQLQAQASVSSTPGDQDATLTTGGALTASEIDAGKLHRITAPIVGTFYRAASPDASPYINVGDKISTGQVICIIEAMKIMNEIESDVKGTVTEILADNAQPVEYNQPLVVIEPS
jgi:acetyl-CoA carboxylase biotin carboxyl carrier protein